MADGNNTQRNSTNDAERDMSRVYKVFLSILPSLLVIFVTLYLYFLGHLDPLILLPQHHQPHHHQKVTEATAVNSNTKVSPPSRPSLILIMLVKNEEEHLQRTLPKWAQVADYWVAGIDDHNADGSAEMFRKYMGHLPGAMVTVAFDGMGPSLTQLVKVGLEKFPQATHGILADADFEPIVPTFTRNKNQLDVHCSFHSFTIWSKDPLSSSSRYMDWIYRNIPGAKVERRTHQSLSVPEIEKPSGHHCHNLIEFEVTEQPGGYQDRSGNKSLTYIALLEADLKDMPNDERTLYYLGHAHLDRWNEYNEEREHLDQALQYFDARSKMTSGYYEQRYLAMIKAGEICARFKNDQSCVDKYWKQAMNFDPARGDAYFYMGQHLRLRGDAVSALPFLSHAVQLRPPFRSQALWYAIYECLAPKEFVIAAFMAKASGPWISELVTRAWKIAERNCGSSFEAERQYVRPWAEEVIMKYQVKKS